MSYMVDVLFDGYSWMSEEGMVTNCSCTLVKGLNNIIVDTMTSWDKHKIVEALQQRGISCDDINYVISTHGHSDHIGNNNLFTKAKHIVGYGVSFKDMYYSHPFETGKPYVIDEDVQIIPTPGHTSADVTLLVKTENKGVVAVTGDLFEKKEDLADPTIWRFIAGSDNPVQQESNRNKILLLADWIIPGHGPMFEVTDAMKAYAKELQGQEGKQKQDCSVLRSELKAELTRLQNKLMDETQKEEMANMHKSLCTMLFK